MKPIRILQVVTTMNRGGLETMLMNYYRQLDKGKIQFDFLTHRNDPAQYDEEIEALGGKIYHLPILNPFSKNYRYELSRFFKTHPEYKIVHSHLDCLSAIPLNYARKHGVPIRIAHGHSASQNKNMKYIVKRYYKRLIPEYATKIFACGDKAGTWMFGKNKYEVFYNAIDAERYVYSLNTARKVRAQINIPSDALVVGHVGRMDHAKNQSYIIDIFMNFHKEHQNSHLVLIGSGPLRDELKQKSVIYGIHNSVHFLGVRSDVPDLMQAMDCLLFPSLFEGLSLVMIEAQAAGLPVLASSAVSKECAITDLVKFMSLDEAPEKWANKLWRMVQQTKRRNTYEEIVVAHYDIKANVKWLEEFYQSQYTLD